MILQRNLLAMIGALLLLAMCQPPPSYAACLLSHCKTERTRVTNTHRQIVGDLYTPVPGQRTQIRDTHRRILGYLLLRGIITNPSRQKKGETNGRYR